MKSFLKSVQVSNFKSFDNFEVELGNFNVLIGGNASGKSNFVQILKFLTDISKEGLDNAISEQGGMHYLTNVKIGSQRDMDFHIKIDIQDIPQQYIINPDFAKLIHVLSINCDFSIGFSELEQFGSKFQSYKIKRDQIKIICELLKVKEDKDNSYPDRWKLISGKDTDTVRFLSKQKKKIEVRLEDATKNEPYSLITDIENEDQNLVDMINIWVRSLRADKLLLESLTSMPIVFFRLDIPIYNFDPKLIKGGTSIKGRAELEQNGSNLALILRDIANSTHLREILKDLLTDILPFIDDFKIYEHHENTILGIKEIYSPDTYFPSFFISDGTANIIAILVALFLQHNQDVVVLEEPDRNIHPRLISNIVSYMEQSSRNRQLILTTHNPELIRHSGVDNILLVGRKEDGFSSIVRPIEKEEIKKFLKNDLGLADLYVQDLLRI